jgi:hypothetical protein
MYNSRCSDPVRRASPGTVSRFTCGIDMPSMRHVDNKTDAIFSGTGCTCCRDLVLRTCILIRKEEPPWDRVTLGLMPVGTLEEVLVEPGRCGGASGDEV